MSVYDETYFERGESTGVSLYTDYKWMPALTVAMAHELVMELGIRRFENILDYGCAKGFMVRAFRYMHYDAYGCDISEYALGHAPEDVKGYLLDAGKPEFAYHLGYQFPDGFDWVISKDVLEHVSYEDLPKTVRFLSNISRRAFVIVPLGEGNKYNAPEYELDKTHIVRENADWWRRTFEENGFRVDVVATEMPYIKRSRGKDSDGFFTLRSRP